MSKSMNVVMIIPTGIGCKIGGHAGDATPVARLLGSVSNKLILHPNVVNASQINEQPENALYVEGSILDRFLEGEIELQEVKNNKILVLVNKPVRTETVNAVNAARRTLGVDAKIVELDTKLVMSGSINRDGWANGIHQGVPQLIGQTDDYEFDALAIISLIEVNRQVADKYWKEGGVNPWGGIEAIVSRMVAEQINKPVAHAPIQPLYVLKAERNGEYDFVCDPRMAAEFISDCFLHYILKGLHKAPRIRHLHSPTGRGLNVGDVDVLVSPYGCWGRPHKACMDSGIPIIVVEENTTIYKRRVCDSHAIGKMFYVKNYLEAAGLIKAMSRGLSLESLK